jgi:hypothetical protein
MARFDKRSGKLSATSRKNRQKQRWKHVAFGHATKNPVGGF